MQELTHVTPHLRQNLNFLICYFFIWHIRCQFSLSLLVLDKHKVPLNFRDNFPTCYVTTIGTIICDMLHVTQFMIYTLKFVFVSNSYLARYFCGLSHILQLPQQDNHNTNKIVLCVNRTTSDEFMSPYAFEIIKCFFNVFSYLNHTMPISK